MINLVFGWNEVAKMMAWFAFLHTTRSLCRRIIPDILLRCKGAKEKQLEETHLKAFRAGDSMWKFLFYIASFSTCLYFAHQMDLLTAISNTWVDLVPTQVSHPSLFRCDNEACQGPTTLNVPVQMTHHDQLFQEFYIAELLYYVFGIWSLIVGLEIVKKDAILLYIHHIVTIILIGGSHWFGFERIGLVVLMTHDIGDVFLEFALFIGYVVKNETVKNTAFGVLIVVWILSRCIYFPFWVIWTCMFDSEGPLLVLYTMDQVKMFQYVFIGLLGSLLLMHVYWTSIMIKMTYNTLVLKKPVADERD